jgi:hypothetical protein
VFDWERFRLNVGEETGNDEEMVKRSGKGMEAGLDWLKQKMNKLKVSVSLLNLAPNGMTKDVEFVVLRCWDS